MDKHTTACLAVLSIFLAAVAADPALAAPQFPNPVYRVGLNPYGLGQADFNGDGIDDLIVSNFSASEGPTDGLSLLIGNGDGTFADAITLPTPQPLTDVLAADFNGDGAADLVVTGYSDSAAYLMLGTGHGTFGPEVLISSLVYRAHLAEFNGDGRPDLLVEAAAYASYFQALINQGNGTFAAAPPVYPGPSQSPAAFDVNGDRRDDVLTMTASSYGYPPNLILIYLGAGDGTFTPAGSIATGEYAFQILSADVDGDGNADFVVDTIHELPNYATTGPFILYFGRGDGSFERGPTSADPSYVTGLVASDLDRDGHRDYVTVNYGDQVQTFMGAGGRTWTEQPWFYTGVDIKRMILGDFEKDGRLDLALLSNFSDAVFIYKGNGDGTFGPPINETIRNSFLGGLVTDDFNGDGVLDIAAALLESDQVTVLPGLGGGSFGAEIRSAAGIGPLYLASADLNHDGRKDLVVATRNWHFVPPTVPVQGSLVILLGNGDGTFQPPASYSGGYGPNALHVADVDGDGHLDVLAAEWTDGTFPPDVLLFPGHADGTLDAPSHLDVGAQDMYPYGWSSPMDVATGDFDGDGRPDIVVGMSGALSCCPGYVIVPGAVRVLRGLGGGAFGSPVTIADTASSAAVTVSDLDGDGDQDIVVADLAIGINVYPGGLYVLSNDGVGGFTSSALLDAGIGPFEVQVADLTLDGYLDLIATDNAGYMTILPGSRSGSFGSPIGVGLFGTPLAMIQGDSDGDGQPDVMIASQSGIFIVMKTAPAPPAIDVTIVTGTKGSGTISWTTLAERALAGFNIVEQTQQGSRQLNAIIVPCEECVTGLGHTYSYFVPKHKSDKKLFVQAVYRDGSVELFGPARRE